MSNTTAIFIVLGFASIFFLGLSLWLVTVVQDLQLDNQKLIIELKYANKVKG